MLPSQVTLDDIVEEKRIIEGVHDVASVMFDEIYQGLFASKRPYELLRDVVLSRLVYPCSKRRTQEKLAKHFGKTHSLEMIYWMMDQVFPKIDQIKQMTFEKTKKLFPEKVDFILFDVTTLYFESAQTEDRYRVPGAYSNNARKIYKAFELERSLDATIYLP